MRVVEPGADLAVAARGRRARSDDAPVATDTVALGEIGLGGEVRQVPQAARRLAEAQRLGFRARDRARRRPPTCAGIELVRVDDVAGRARGRAPLDD